MEYVVRAPSDFGLAGAEFRALRHVSQAVLAQQISVQRTYLSKLEQGEVTTALERLWAALDALDVDLVIRQRT